MVAEPLFSIIIPTRDRAELLAQAVRSVQEQTVESFECIIVDDCGVRPAVAPARDRRFRVRRLERNQGVAAARNAGIAAARGRYVTFLDDDDVLLPNRLELALVGLQRAPVALCWSGNLDEYPQHRPGRHLYGMVYDIILDATTPHLGTVAVERSVLPAFDERFRALEDVEWWLRLAATSAVATAAEIGYLYRRHTGIRQGNGLPQRVAFRRLLLHERSDYFTSHPRAQAFQLKRLGLTAQEFGDHRAARRAFTRSFATRPDLDVLWHLRRSAFRPSRSTERSGVAHAPAEP